MQLLSTKLLLVLLVIVLTYGYISGCTHKEMVLPAASTDTTSITRGSGVFRPGTLTIGDTTQWKFDQVHSSVLWSGSYLGEAGLLTGRFNMFGINSIPASSKKTYLTTGQPLPDTSWSFYENDPTKTFFNGYVQVNTSNTGEPGRDAGPL